MAVPEISGLYSTTILKIHFIPYHNANLIPIIQYNYGILKIIHIENLMRTI